MQGLNPQRLQWPEAQARGACLVLAFMMLVLAGCATGGKSMPETYEGSSRAEDPSARGPSWARLEDGREGFIIRETPRMDAASVRDFERAIALIKKKEYDQAIELLEEIIAQSPGITAPYINVAIACKHLNKWEQAEQHLKTALELVPGHPVASNEYGLLLRKAGRFDEARVIYEKALKNFPVYHPARRNLGILCDLYLNDPECALEHYQIYSEAIPEDEQVKVWIVDLRMQQGDEEK